MASWIVEHSLALVHRGAQVRFLGRIRMLGEAKHASCSASCSRAEASSNNVASRISCVPSSSSCVLLPSNGSHEMRAAYSSAVIWHFLCFSSPYVSTDVGFQRSALWILWLVQHSRVSHTPSGRAVPDAYRCVRRRLLAGNPSIYPIHVSFSSQA
jgi:hypothetical protein